jgi:Lrp/AsnC family transcriptional regulator, leucine-responsive regulatory protein
MTRSRSTRSEPPGNQRSIDKSDQRILELLQMDGALSNVELAERVNLSPSACLRRVKLLMETGLVEGTHLVLDDQAEAGFEGTAYVYMR